MICLVLHPADVRRVLCVTDYAERDKHLLTVAQDLHQHGGRDENESKRFEDELVDTQRIEWHQDDGSPIYQAARTKEPRGKKMCHAGAAFVVSPTCRIPSRELVLAGFVAGTESHD
jgi:hypothetical protein